MTRKKSVNDNKNRRYDKKKCVATRKIVGMTNEIVMMLFLSFSLLLQIMSFRA